MHNIDGGLIMAEQSIKIKIAGREYPLKVNSQDHEEVVRKAADDINRMITIYQDKFPGKPLVEIMSFVALNVCMSNHPSLSSDRQNRHCL